MLFSDADLSTPIAELEKLLIALDEPCDIAIGSRALPGARIEVHQPRYREHLGRLFNAVVRRFAVPGIFDTQCGFKCFRRQAALAICERMTTERFGFDVEMLYLACQLGFRTREVPVVWRHSPQTRVRLQRDSLSMLGDLVRIRLNDYRGRYRQPPPQSMPGPRRVSGASLSEGRSVAQATDHFGGHSSDQP
jgi:dolichyl-phosphate beta-glucosyltransferase